MSGTEVTLPADLAAGTVFWRLTTRTAAALGPNVSPTWVLYVEPGTCPLSPFAVRVADDYDGDGVRDSHRVEGRNVVVNYSVGIPATTFALPADRYGFDGSYETDDLYAAPDAAGIGDVSGDGRSDFAWFYSHSSRYGSSRHYDRGWLSRLSGPDGIERPGMLRANLGSDMPRTFQTQVHAVGDIDRDGYSDVLTYQDDGYSTTGPVWRFLTHEGDWPVPRFCGDDELHGSDINGDRVMDVVIDGCPSVLVAYGSHFALGNAARGAFGLSNDLPGCDALGVRTGYVRVIGIVDTNCDGYADVAASYGDVRFVLFGGPDGLSSTRCAALPVTP